MTLVEMDHKSACAYIKEAEKLGSRPGLSTIASLCDLLGNPEKKLPVIHIAGTNGKGSTAAMIASALSLAGLKTGMYYSPALCGMTDHYHVDGEPVGDGDYDEAVSVVASANEELKKNGDGATAFELETAVAFVCFCKKNCDIAVMECGMGGRDDATNIAANKICAVITSVSYDHMQYLGNTIASIAGNKAGIITSDCPVIAFDSSKEATGVIKKRCETTGSRLHIVDGSHIEFCEKDGKPVMDYDEYKDVRIGLSGTFQAQNAAVALRTLSVIRDEKLIPGFCPDDDLIKKAIQNVRWPFRFEKINDDPPVYVDGAHNADAAIKLRDSVRTFLAGSRLVLVIGVFSDKEYEKVVKPLAQIADSVITVETPDNPRALDTKILAKVAEKYCKKVKACDTIDDAYIFARKEAETIKTSSGSPVAILACGSLSYLSIFSKAVKGNAKS